MKMSNDSSRFFNDRFMKKSSSNSFLFCILFLSMVISAAADNEEENSMHTQVGLIMLGITIVACLLGDPRNRAHSEEPTFNLR